MRAPDPYPRTPYLWRNDGRTDNVAAAADRAAWFGVPVVVEEKLDGANVSLWLDDGAIRVAPRGGLGAMDRGGQLGRLRAWVAEHHEQLRPMLAECAVYGEWLWLEHTVKYDRLPDWLIILDAWHPDLGMLSTAVRDRVVQEAGLLVPPRVFVGELTDCEALSRLLARGSTWGEETREGLVLRRETDEARCKIVRAGFTRKADEAWAKRSHNRRLSR